MGNKSFVLRIVIVLLSVTAKFAIGVKLSEIDIGQFLQPEFLTGRMRGPSPCVIQAVLDLLKCVCFLDTTQSLEGSILKPVEGSCLELFRNKEKKIQRFGKFCNPYTKKGKVKFAKLIDPRKRIRRVCGGLD